MLGLLMNLILMSVVLSGLLKTYYFFPLLNKNPEITGATGIMFLLIILWIFPKIIGLFIKFAIFCSIVFFIGNVTGLNLNIFKNSEGFTDKIIETKKTLSEITDKVKQFSETNSSFSATPSRINNGRNIQFENENIQLYGIDAPDTMQLCKNAAGANMCHCMFCNT